ncbi:MAG TPA: extracellular solute-binding protein, partial [Gammaproteobacteria bacterium]|nr:extracellular solute-binding protein [Gammaproteobacteria bacterium]
MTTRQGFAIGVLTLLLAACGGGGGSEPSGAASESPAASEAGTVVATTTRYVESLPTYPTEPLPEGLVWETNLTDPIYASPEAKRGGEYRYWLLSFPLTLRLVGPDSNDAFTSYMRANDAALTDIHPNTRKPIPQLATEWAFAPDGKTVYYRLDPSATWSDGLPVTADDYVFTLEFMRSEHIVDPWYNDHYTKDIVAVRKHDDHTISIEGSTAKPRDELLFFYGLAPTPRQFHKLDAKWVEDYNWRIPPGTGPYQISRIEKGQYIEFKRNPSWWGDKQRYFEHRYNVDTIRLTVIRDQNVAWEYFLRGELDTFNVVFPNFWHDKAQGELFDKGYIGKYKYYTETPMPSYGLWLNMDDPLLGDRNVRLGLHHSMNVDLLLSGLLRGDYERLKQHYEGYGDYTDTSIGPRPFDLAKADEYFKAAGFAMRGPDGIRVKDRQRLSFTISYGNNELTPRMVVLREEARKAGVELNLQVQDSAATFKQTLEKKHQIAFMAWSPQHIPAFWEHYHSDNAHIPQTNNITATDDAELDKIIIEQRDAIDLPTRIRLSHEIQQRVWEIGAFIPLYKVPYVREVAWRWVRLPETHGTRMTDPYLFDPISQGLRT